MTRIDLKSVFKEKSDSWKALNPILSVGMVFYESDTNQIKISDGLTPYNELPYVNGGFNLQDGEVADVSSIMLNLENLETTVSALDSEMGDKADDSMVMHKQGNMSENIGGEKLFDNIKAKNTFSVLGDTNSGNVFNINYEGQYAQIITNNGLRFISDVKFGNVPEIEANKTLEELSDNSLLTKKQILEAIENALKG